MNLSFFPGNLHLTRNHEGIYVIRIGSEEVFTTKSERVALAKFKSLKQALEAKFPKREPTKEEKAELLQREINDSLLGHNSLGGRRKKTSAGSTRTFGG